jgi:hypothetical protein
LVALIRHPEWKPGSGSFFIKGEADRAIFQMLAKASLLEPDQFGLRAVD